MSETTTNTTETGGQVHPMVSSDITILEQQTPLTLAAWWSLLNSWGWPDALPDPEPRESKPGGRRGKIMDWIQGKIGFKECLRDWNKESMPGENFDSWYDGKFTG